jgi:hypothetical protein
MRWTIRANQTFSPGTLKLLKKAAGWGSGGRIHSLLSLDGARPEVSTPGTEQ